MDFCELLQQYDQLPRPDRSNMGFVRELETFDLSTARKDLHLQIINPEVIPQTVLESLQRQFTVSSDADLTLTVIDDLSLPPEGFRVEFSGKKLTVYASGDAGIRYGVYELEEMLKNNITGTVEKTPAIKHRITRSCFSPNSRPPLRLDELSDEIDYYPEAYLDRLAHERMNGVWITIYLYEMPSSLFPARELESGRKKLAKLQKVVDKCARYGIKCYLFCTEPKGFNTGGFKTFTAEDLANHPELSGHKEGKAADFCTSSAAGQQYLTETIGHIFSTVHGLGGMINIMCLEGSYPCGTRLLYPHISTCNCPVCSKKTAPEIFAGIARTMSAAMRKEQPDAEFFGWFYRSIHFHNEPENDLIREVAEAWPEDCFFMNNCETGGNVTQLGKTMTVQDYSLSWAGPSEYWKSLKAKKMAAKIQTGCSHGNASVPYMPLPGILYDRYRGLTENNCQAVMQCWYFGAYPGLMNQAAGELSFLPFPANKKEFLISLCRKMWGKNAEKAACAMMKFSEAANFFPETLSFKWYGPLHHELVFPWHLEPAALPLAPSYTLSSVVNCGDMVGECCDYDFTPAEIRTLLCNMDECWQSGLKILQETTSNEVQKKEAALAEFIGLQISGTLRWFEFYRLRDEMILTGKDNSEKITKVIREEIAATARACILCENDPRLGYHAEVENYLIYPEKLRARIKLLEKVLLDLPQWDAAAEKCRFWKEGNDKNICITGEKDALWQKLDKVDYRIFEREKRIVFQFRNVSTAKLRLEYLPALSRKVLSASLNYGRPGHWIGFPPGMEFFRDNEIAELRINTQFFQPFRISADAPHFFNLTVNGQSLSPRHDFPERLWLTSANPYDLIPLIRK